MTQYTVHIETDSGERIGSYPVQDLHSIGSKVVLSIHSHILQTENLPRMESYSIVAEVLKMSVRRVRELISKNRN